MFHDQTDKLAVGVGAQRQLGITKQNRVENAVVASYGAKKKEKEQKQQHMNRTENISLKGCTTEGARNYDQTLSGRPDSGPISSHPPGSLRVDGAEQKACWWKSFAMQFPS